ncbi:hypothetical protein DY000_02041567 [Brassica cretica]|uniref:Zinc finger GRF-type domain-containing protein n=1 Tax=Brassica cretica TaxID=69181 RepID=A0ABQ7B7D9_BRACR|nr:hypothetical protein DY000_02041567 [Brassica cretica]
MLSERCRVKSDFGLEITFIFFPSSLLTAIPFGSGSPPIASPSRNLSRLFRSVHTDLRRLQPQIETSLLYFAHSSRISATDLSRLHPKPKRVSFISLTPCRSQVCVPPPLEHCRLSNCSNCSPPPITGIAKSKEGMCYSSVLRVKDIVLTVVISQTSSTNAGDHEIRPEGVKAAKSKRNTAQGKSLAEYTTIWEMKKDDLAMKEKLSKLAILDTLLAKKEPLSEAEEVKLNMGHDYSYSQPSESEDYGGNSVDSGYSETEDLIRRDQAEISYNARAPVQYPRNPSRNDPGRRYYTCENVDDGECHVWKWWDVAVMEEMRARDRHVLQLAEKVDNLTLLSDYETEQKLTRLEKIVCDLGKEKSRFGNGFEYFVGVVVIVLVSIGMVLMFK